MPTTNTSNEPTGRDRVAIGFDPGRDKCGIARVVLTGSPIATRVAEMAVVESAIAIERVVQQCQRFEVSVLAIGDGTSSKQWRQRLETVLPASVSLAIVNEHNSTQEARDRYWELYPPRRLQRLVPAKLRAIPRPIDDIVAVILVERWAAEFCP